MRVRETYNNVSEIIKNYDYSNIRCDFIQDLEVIIQYLSNGDESLFDCPDEGCQDCPLLGLLKENPDE